MGMTFKLPKNNKIHQKASMPKQETCDCMPRCFFLCKKSCTFPGNAWVPRIHCVMGDLDGTIFLPGCFFFMGLGGWKHPILCGLSMFIIDPYMGPKKTLPTGTITSPLPTAILSRWFSGFPHRRGACDCSLGGNFKRHDSKNISIPRIPPLL